MPTPMITIGLDKRFPADDTTPWTVFPATFATEPIVLPAVLATVLIDPVTVSVWNTIVYYFSNFENAKLIFYLDILDVQAFVL